MHRPRGVAARAAVAAQAIAVGVDCGGGQGKRENEHVGVACLGVKWAGGGRFGFLSQGHGSQHGSWVLERKVCLKILMKEPHWKFLHRYGLPFCIAENKECAIKLALLRHLLVRLPRRRIPVRRRPPPRRSVTQPTLISNGVAVATYHPFLPPPACFDF